MDTRAKIVGSDEAARAAARERAAGRRVTLVTGCFDPLLAAHARRLEEIAQPGAALFVAVSEPAEPMLPARARAELTAALRVVDYVILPDRPLAAVAAALQPDAVHREESSDLERTRDLIEHVQRRQSAS